jgi:hypothetical protein
VITAPFVVRRAARFVGAIGLSLLCATIARAQTRITGVVTDSAGGFPVSGVNVTISGTTLGALTGEEGRYTINGVSAGTHIIEARRLGYALTRRTGVIVTAGQTATVDIKMASTALHLQETVITGVVDPTAGTKVPFTVGRVTREDAPVPPMNAIAGVQGKIAGVAMVGPGATRRWRQHSVTDANEHQQEQLAPPRRRRRDPLGILGRRELPRHREHRGREGSGRGVVVRFARSERSHSNPHVTRQRAPIRTDAVHRTLGVRVSAMSRDVQRAQYHFYMTNARRPIRERCRGGRDAR